MFPHCSLWKNQSPFICVFSPVGANMKVFLLAGKAWELRLGRSSLQGPCKPGPGQASLLLLSTEIVRSPGSVCQEQVITQAATRVALPPAATARRQHSRTQCEERCLLVCCQSYSEMPHVLKTLPSVQQRVPVSMQGWGKIEGPQRFLGLEVVSRLQKVDDVIRCKWSVEC